MERKGVLTYLPHFLWQLLPIFLYAETHYRFKYFFSFLRKKEPEIIADAPHRLEPDSPLPILILVKDAHLFPVKINRITIIIRSAGLVVLEKNLVSSPFDINQKLWWRLFSISVEGLTRTIECDVIFELSHNHEKRIYHNDNHRTSTHDPLKVYVSASKLPRFPNLHLGECHSHSNYTDDQVEFGSPLGASVHLCKSMGITFFCATDHSYDLDDSIDNYLINDPNLPKWKQLQHEVAELNSTLTNFKIVRGEEVTCRNSQGQNVHLLLLGNKRFFLGKGDGAEKWLRTRSEYSIDEILDEKELTTVAYAAHPQEPVSFLQRLLLNRGIWLERDVQNQKLTGIQFANGQLSSGFKEGYRQWLEALLQGKRLYILAGNDAHGNFNRFRQIGIPFIKIHEMEHQIFGKMRTGVFIDSLSEENLLKSIRSGTSIITDGPIVNLRVFTLPKRVSSIGCNYSGPSFSIQLDGLSSNEFGSIESLIVFKGIIGQKEIELISKQAVKDYSIDLEFSLKPESPCYIRAELWTSSKDSSDNKQHFCMTNPIWFSPP